ncbi:glycine cleavage system protein GcvH [Varunaivibrio sulfuroxidans]|uniref:Glycine cleavage system H protein n=1 Tax=Varunaivibrio sulfuroxidans TaxID=1773489 RepID=A0A4R3JBI7_9PROT|nr:glycine cleavage system protein GcvH [Varunaivibrio sulfuroxidans]TCS62665.1 glycine cleavage system H protein [Varunaivibrio sulfuroxidans]WES30670.1 glycine cleavage system protein GcvH [Varunaivibrio sulfuroxidans]
MSTVKYTKEHEWVRVEGDSAYVGVSQYALEQLGDLVFVEVPEAGRELKQGDEAAVVESVKAASEIYAPLSGAVLEGNAAVADDPTAVSPDANGDGWFFKMSIADAGELDGLMDEDAYRAYTAGLE